MSNDVDPEDRTWAEGEAAILQLKASLRQAHRVVDAARSNLIGATDPLQAANDTESPRD